MKVKPSPKKHPRSKAPAASLRRQHGIAMVEGLLVAGISAAVLASLMPSAFNAYDTYKVQKTSVQAVESVSKLSDYFIVFGSTAAIAERVPEILQLQPVSIDSRDASLIASVEDQVVKLQKGVKDYYEQMSIKSIITDPNGTCGSAGCAAPPPPTGQIGSIAEVTGLEFKVQTPDGQIKITTKVTANGVEFYTEAGTKLTAQQLSQQYNVNLSDPALSQLWSNVENTTGEVIQLVGNTFQLMDGRLRPDQILPGAPAGALNVYFGATPSGVQTYRTDVGTAVTFTSVSLFQPNDAFVISYNGLTGTQCAKMLPLVSKNFTGMSVNGQVLTGPTGQIMPQQSVSGPRAVQLCTEQANVNNGFVNVHLLAPSLVTKYVGQTPYGSNPTQALGAHEAKFTVIDTPVSESKTLKPVAPSSSGTSSTAQKLPGSTYTPPTSIPSPGGGGTTTSGATVPTDPCGGWGYGSTIVGCSGGVAPSPPPPPTDPYTGGGDGSGI